MRQKQKRPAEAGRSWFKVVKSDQKVILSPK